LKFSEQQGVGAGLQSRDHDDTYPQHNNTIKSKSNTTKRTCQLSSSTPCFSCH
jgi:hypothetical protein